MAGALKGPAKEKPATNRPAPGQPDRGEEIIRALETGGRQIQDPVAKLRYLRSSLARYQKIDRCIEAVPSPIARRVLYRWLSLEGLRHLMNGNSFGAPMLEASLHQSARWSRLISGVTIAVIVGGVVAGIVVVARSWQTNGGTPPVLAATGPLPEVAESLPPLPRGVRPAQVWVVEKGDGWEQYSNGLRIDTTYSVAGDPRRYRSFVEEKGMLDDVGSKPIGILFHTSESDIWPMEAANNEKLRDSSQHILRYVQRGRLYNYLIDRFGRVFRVVDEEGKANHAGAGIWSRDDVVYLNLNNAFLGICFETRWDGGRALPITAAQLAAGRSLTEYLRLRWEISGEMCAAHGMTSVNPKQHLIGHHVDWARGFPFDAFGLPDQYARVAPSVALFGFGYDDKFLRVLGEPWAGVRSAESMLATEAARQGKTLDDYRRERRALYDRWHSDQTKDEEAAASLRADRGAPAAPVRGSGVRSRGSGG
jgi:hypothetical protein